MKKMILLAAFAVAGTISAKGNVENNIVDESKKTQTEQSETSEKNQLEAQKQFNCISYTLSCGWPSFACGYSTAEILIAVWENDANVCG
ncbi:hypothetical protein VUJ46_04760 [Chryseobacterium sp. MYb264]|uniref:hypothetical protein n=1 Tax=Chryseobacterium sp. MYb264 TaxID=2745153 RepID=UPI002E15565F|nr:hypothetical protein VUJ46_04760 [Chryseobacterium sp. MYb264]